MLSCYYKYNSKNGMQQFVPTFKFVHVRKAAPVYYAVRPYTGAKVISS